MLLRNMIFRLNVEMIDSPKGEYDIFDFVKSYILLTNYSSFMEKAAPNGAARVDGVPKARLIGDGLVKR